MTCSAECRKRKYQTMRRAGVAPVSWTPERLGDNASKWRSTCLKVNAVV
jgi:hypothetical protein